MEEEAQCLVSRDVDDLIFISFDRHSQNGDLTIVSLNPSIEILHCSNDSYSTEISLDSSLLYHSKKLPTMKKAKLILLMLIKR